MEGIRMDNPFDDAEQAQNELLEQHDLQADAEEAHELLEEVVGLWDGLEHSGRIARLRRAQKILQQTLEWNSWRIERETDAEHYCPDCGSTEISHEDIGSGQSRVYCADCDHTLQGG